MASNFKKYKSLLEKDIITDNSALSEDENAVPNKNISIKRSSLISRTKHKDRIVTFVFTFINLTLAFFVLLSLSAAVLLLKDNHENFRSYCKYVTNTRSVVIPKIDDRNYSFFVLSNKIRVLLISDCNTTKSGAALSVSSGSYNDRGIGGLAHFCEHLLFLGNRKYPKNDYLFDYLALNDGFANAYTALGETNYFFNVDSDYFTKSLDIFSNFFIYPLFTEEFVDKEINAVNSEYLSHLQSDIWRFYQLLIHLSDIVHPLHGFPIGKVSTLNITNIRDIVISYYYNHYSSNIMTLVLYDKQSIENLSSIAKKYFQVIPNNNLYNRFYSYPFSSTPLLIICKALEDTHKLTYYWQFSSFRNYYQLAPEFICYLFNNYAVGSLIDTLKSDNLIQSLIAFSDSLVSTTLFTIEVSIDSDILYDGRWKIITKRLFSFVNQFKLLHSSRIEEMFEKWQVNKAIKFDFTKNSDIFSMVGKLAGNMHHIFLTSDLLSPPCQQYYNYSYLYNLFLNISPDRMILLVTSNSFSTNTQNGNWPPLSLTEQYFGTNYVQTKFDESDITEWNSTKPGYFVLPIKTLYPKNFQILPKSNDNTIPNILMTKPGLTLWHSQYTKYGDPRIVLQCDLYSNNISSNLWQNVLSKLYIYIVEEAIKSQLVEFNDLCSFSVSLNTYDSKINLHYDCYSDSHFYLEFFDVANKILKNSTLLTSEILFDIGKFKLLSFINNFYQANSPYLLAYDYYFNLIINNIAYKLEDIVETLSNINKSHLVNYVKNLGINTNIICYAFGNLNDSFAKIITWNLKVTLAASPLSNHINSFTIKYCNNMKYSLTLKNKINDEVNSAVDIIYQIGKTCLNVSNDDKYISCDSAILRDHVLMSILLNIMRPMCFNVLRTQEQLGYIVFCATRTIKNYEYIHVIIQSATRNPEYLQERVDSFISALNTTLHSKNSTNWNDIFTSYYSSLKDTFDSFAEAQSKLWSFISERNYQFDINSQIKSIFNNISYNDILQYFNRNFIYDEAPRINIRLYASIYNITQVGSIDFENINTFKKELSCN